MELKTRRVELAGITASPNEPWMKQVAMNLTDYEGILRGKQYLVIDRDTKFSATYQGVLRREGIEPKLLPPRSPNLNAHIERFMRSVKEECLDRMIFFGEESLRQATRSYLAHYHTERNYQGMRNQLLRHDPNIEHADGPIKRSERLGGLLSYYYREAA